MSGVYTEPESAKSPYQTVPWIQWFSSRGAGSGYQFEFTMDMISLASISVGFLAQYTNQSQNAQKVWAVLQGLWRYLSFYSRVDPRAGLAFGVYWSSAYYLYGVKYMPVAYLLDLGAGRLYTEKKYNDLDRAEEY